MRRLLLVVWVFVAGIAFVAPRHATAAQEEKQPMLATIDLSGNVIVYDAAGQNPVAITTDADRRTRAYQWPTWSTDGRLAFFGFSADPTDSFGVRAFILETPNDIPQTAWTSREDVFTYSYWAPGSCAGENCRNLAVLYTPADQSGLAVNMIQSKGGQYTSQLVERAAPFYYSFSPDGKKMIWHRFNRILEIYDVATNTVEETLPDTPGAFQSPMWSPIDGRILFAVAGRSDGLADLVIADGTARTPLLKDQSTPLYFAWSPDAQRVASLTGGDNLTVTDIGSGAKVASAPQRQIVGFFWSPSGDRVAFLSLTPSAPRSSEIGMFSTNGHTESATFGSDSDAQGSPPALTWYVLDIATGNVQALTAFNPTREMVYYLNFFDQFSRSHRLWSPDGRYLVYGAVPDSGLPEVLLADTRNPGQTVRVGEGVVGVWSWQ